MISAKQIKPILLMVCFFTLFYTSPSPALNLSEEYGYVKSSYTAKSFSADSPVIYYIQDAHCNAEAQMNIYHLIEQLVAENQVDFVAVEGASGDINPVDLRKFPYEEAKHIVSYHFVKEGRLSGAEYYSINAKHPVPVHGVEQKELYQGNRDALLTAYSYSDTVEILNDLQSELNSAKQDLYSSELKILDECENKFDANDMSLTHFLQSIQTLSQDAGCDTSAYHNLHKCWDMISLESQLNFESIETERARLIKMLTEKMDKTEASAFLQENLRFRMHKLSYLSHLEYLISLAKRFHIDLDAYPQLLEYREYLVLHESIDRYLVFTELESLRNDLFNAFAESETQSVVRRIDRENKLLKKAFQLQSVSREWEELNSSRIFFEDNKAMSFLKEIGVTVLDDTSKTDALKERFSCIRTFYNYAERRDSVLVQNTLAYMNDNGLKRGVIIAGGYHESGIIKKLSARDITHHVIGVNISRQNQDNPYFALMSGEYSPLERFLANNAGTLALASWLDENSMSRRNERFIFAHMFKSLLLSTLAWQLTGYDIASMSEVDLPLLRGVQRKLEEVVRQTGYDIDIIEISRIDNQIYVRVRVAEHELIYGLFSEESDIDMAELVLDPQSSQKPLASFQFLGGAVVVVKTEKYNEILQAAERKMSSLEGGPVSVVRSLFTHGLSAHLARIFAIEALNGSRVDELPSVAYRVADELATVDFSEDKASIESFIRMMVEEYQLQNKLSVEHDRYVFSDYVLSAALIARQSLSHPEGHLIKLPESISKIPVDHGSVQFIFANSSIPVEIIEQLFYKLDEDTQPGSKLVLGSVGNEEFVAEFSRLQGNHYFVLISNELRLPAFRGIEELYSSVLGRESVEISVRHDIHLALNAIGDHQYSISLIAVNDDGEVIDTFGPTETVDVLNKQQIDVVLSKFYDWLAAHNIRISGFSGSVRDRHVNFNNMIYSLFLYDNEQLEEYRQIENFKRLLRLYSYTAGKNMPNIQKIISDQVANIIAGEDPISHRIPAVLQQPSSVVTAFNENELELVYHVYLHHLNYQPDEALLSRVDPSVLSRIIEDSLIDPLPVAPEDPRARIIELLSGGKFLAKLDVSSVAKEIDRIRLRDIFSDVAGLEITFTRAGISHENTKRIRVTESRLSGYGLLSDFKVVVEDYQGNEYALHLRVLQTPVLGIAFAHNLNTINSETAQGINLFPKIYFSKTHTFDGATTPGYYFAEHIDGYPANHIETHPDSFSAAEAMIIKMKAAQAWFKFWEAARTPDSLEDEIEASEISLPIVLSSVVFPSDGSDPKILGIGYAIPTTPVSFFQALFGINTGFHLKSSDHIPVLANAMIRAFGWTRTKKLLSQAIAEYKAGFQSLYRPAADNIQANSLGAMLAYVIKTEELMSRDTVQQLVDIVYEGDTLAAFADLADNAIRRNLNLIEMLSGKLSAWENRLPSINEVRGAVRRLRPSVLTISGGTGGNSMINAIKSLGAGNTVNIVTTFDTGGQSYKWQGIMEPHVGFVPSLGDTTNLAISYLIEAQQDLLNKRLPADQEIDAIYPLVADIILPTLKKYPGLKEHPDFLINFIDITKKIDEFIGLLRAKHREDPQRYQPIELQKASIKNLILEAFNYFSKSYDFENKEFNVDNSLIALNLIQRFFNIDTGYVVPVSTDEGNLVMHLKQPLTFEEIQAVNAELPDTTLGRNRIGDDGKTIYGEDLIGNIGNVIKNFGQRIDFLGVVRSFQDTTSKPSISDMAAEALSYPELDLILVGPGNVFTSLLPNFTLKEVVDELVARGQTQIRTMPDGQRIHIEPAKRVFILNPVHTSEDMGMSIPDLISAIERTAQNASGNPNLKFHDMFDTIVINDTATASEDILEFIRSKRLALIEATERDLDFLFQHHISTHAYAMTDVQERPSREPGYELQYKKKLEYAQRELRIMVNIFLQEVRTQKERNPNNFGIGDGHHSPQDRDRVREIIKKSPRILLEDNNDLLIRARRWMSLRVRQLEKRIEREQDAAVSTGLKNDFEFLKQVAERLRSSIIPVHRVEVENSLGFFIDDSQRYQFATIVEFDEKDLPHGIYFSSGLLDAINGNLRSSQDSMDQGDLQSAEYFRLRASALIGEALFYQVAEWMLFSQDPERFDQTEANMYIERLISDYVGINRPMYGSLLNEKFARLVNQELTQRADVSPIEQSSLPFDEGQRQIELLERDIQTVRIASAIGEQLYRETSEFPAYLRRSLTRFLELGEAPRQVLAAQNVQSIIAELGFESFEQMIANYSERIHRISTMFDNEVTNKVINDYLNAVLTLERLFKAMHTQTYQQLERLGAGERREHFEMVTVLNEILYDVQSIAANLFQMHRDSNVLAMVNNLQTVSIADMESRLRTLQLIVTAQHQQPEIEDEPTYMQVLTHLSSMRSTELEKWMNSQIVNRTQIEITNLRPLLREFLSTMDAMVADYPKLIRPQFRPSAEELTQSERTVVQAMEHIQVIRDNIALDSFPAIYNVQQALHQLGEMNLFLSLELIIPQTHTRVRRMITTAQNLFIAAENRSERIRKTIRVFESRYPKAFARFVEYQQSTGKISGTNIGLGDGHHSQLPERITRIISDNDVTRLQSDDVLLEGVKDHLLRLGNKTLRDSITLSEPERFDSQNKARLLFRIYTILQNNEFRFWTVRPTDGNPALFIDDEQHYQFAAVRGHDVYFSHGMIDRLSYLYERGAKEYAVVMLAESIVHEIGEQIIHEDTGDAFDLQATHDYMIQMGQLISGIAPPTDLDGSARTSLYYELQRLVNYYIATENTDIRELPLFEYPSDISQLRSQLHSRLLSGELSETEFLNVVVSHFNNSTRIGAPSEILYNNHYYHPGEVYGFVGESVERYGYPIADSHMPLAQNIINLAHADGMVKERAISVISTLLTDVSYSSFINNLSLHELEDIMYDIIRIITADDNPYKALKEEYNAKGVAALDDMEAVIGESPEPLRAAALVAIAGNALDFANLETAQELTTGDGFNFIDSIRGVFEPLVVKRDDFEHLLQRLQQSPQKVVYAIDNAGEIITDFPLLKRILQMGHTVYLVTRDKPTVNDVSLADAQNIFQSDYARQYFVDVNGNSLLSIDRFHILTSGSNVTGTDLRRATPDFLDVWQNADLRIMKGQGNYETLRDFPVKQDMFFLLKVKDPNSTENRYAKGDVLIEYRNSNPFIKAYFDGNIEQIIHAMQPGAEESLSEFITFYIDYVAEQAREYTVSMNEDRLISLYAEARLIFEKVSALPEINLAALSKLNKKFRAQTPFEDFLWNLIEPDQILVESAIDDKNQHVIMIDFESVPDGDLNYAAKILDSIHQSRPEAAGIQVRWVIYSTELSEQALLEKLLQRNFYMTDMQLVGQETFAALSEQWPQDTTLSQLYHHIAANMPENIPGSAIKMITNNEQYLSEAVDNNMYVIQIAHGDLLSEIADFIAALVSADAFIFGGRAANLMAVDPLTGQEQPLIELLNGQRGGSIDSIAGRVLRLMPAAPTQEKLERIQMKQVVDQAI